QLFKVRGRLGFVPPDEQKPGLKQSKLLVLWMGLKDFTIKPLGIIPLLAIQVNLYESDLRDLVLGVSSEHLLQLGFGFLSSPNPSIEVRNCEQSSRRMISRGTQ